MNGTLNILVKKANPLSKMWSSSMGGFGALAKYSVYFYIDGKECGKLKSSKTAYSFSLPTGKHSLQFTRNKIGALNLAKTTSSVLTGVIDAAVDNDGLFSAMHESLYSDQDNADGCVTVEIKSGQTVVIEIQHRLNGNPIPVIISQ